MALKAIAADGKKVFDADVTIAPSGTAIILNVQPSPCTMHSVTFSMYSPPPVPCILSHSQCTVLPLHHAFCHIPNVQSFPCTMHSVTKAVDLCQQRCQCANATCSYGWWG